MKSKQELIEEWESAIEAAEFYGKGEEERLISYMKDFVSDLNQLDEPEVLSDKWIDDNSVYASSDGITEEYVHVDDLQNLLVPRQELPVIPKFVADYIDDRKEVGFPIYQAIRIVRENSRFEHSHLREWLWTNKSQETFVRAWLDGYTVEEQKYVVEFPNITGSDERYLVQGDDGDLWVDGDLDYLQRFDIPKHIFTEEEIKSFDKDYWAFAKPVEEVD